MSLDIINQLPPELLYLVFDLLKPNECSSAAGVCSRWSEMLLRYPQSDDDDVPKGDCLTPEGLAEDNLDEVRQYRWVIISIDRFKTAEDKVKLERYLFSEELLENLEDLELNGLYYGSEAGRELYLPNVRKIRIAGVSQPPDQNAVPCRIVAPKLRTFHQASDTIREPLVWVNGQIVDMVAIHCEKTQLFYMMGDLPFENLRSLSLTVIGLNRLEESDFTEKFRALLSRLDHLKIEDWHCIFYPVLATILKEAKHLQMLELWGRIMSGYAFTQMNNLKHLKKLTLNMLIEDKDAQMSLPSLTKLETYFMDLPSLQNVPCLNSLLVAIKPNTYKSLDLASYLRPVAHQLKRLELSRVFLDSSCIEAICSLENLTSLKLSEVKVEFSAIEQVFRRLTNLRLAKFEYCRMAETIVICRECCNCGCQYCADLDGEFAREGRRPTVRYRNFFETLRSRHVDCAVVVGDKGRMVKCLRVIRYPDVCEDDPSEE